MLTASSADGVVLKVVVVSCSELVSSRELEVLGVAVLAVDSCGMEVPVVGVRGVHET